jgi:tRNA threonylcarbamoyladenosine biosynthesis protein TsaB
MRTLVIDTATPACSVALFDGGTMIDGHYEIIGRGHAERLVPFINNLPGKGRADQIAVNTGPGSFTGIRVGISAARALAYAWGVPCGGYSCLNLVAAMSMASGTVDVIMNGGHGEYYFQQFDKDSAPLSNPVSIGIESAAQISNAPVLAGDAASLLAEYCPDRVLYNHLPDARKWHLISNHAPLSSSPYYGRAPDAKLPGNKTA